MHVITESLLVGNIDDAREPPPTVSALLLVAEEFEITPSQWITFSKIPMKEFAPVDPATLSRAVDWLEQHVASNRVMVCCRAGMGRSASVIMAYLCCIESMAYSEAVKLVMDRRPGSMPLPKLQESIQAVLQIRKERARFTGKVVKRIWTTPKSA